MLRMSAKAAAMIIICPKCPVVSPRFFRTGKTIPIEKIDVIMDTIQTSLSIRLVDMTIECWKDFLKLEIPELHDRMIVASHFSYKTDAILTNDPEIEDVTLTIWS